MQEDQAFNFPIGTVISECYQIEAPVWQDECCDVYRVKHNILNQKFLVKILRMQFAVDKPSVLRIQMESRHLSRLAHKALPTVYDFSIHENVPYLVMEDFEGTSLEELVQKAGPLSVERFKEVFKQVANGMDHVHENGIIHTDLKPESIMVSLDDDGSVKVKVVGFIWSRGAEDSPGLTANGHLTGSPYYMSPEQCMGEGVHKRSDVYTLGATMFFALTGSPPFPGATMIDTMSKHISEQPPQITEDKNSPIYAIQQMVIDKCLEKKPEQRFQSMKDLEAGIVGKEAVHKPSASLRGTEKKKGWWPF